MSKLEAGNKNTWLPQVHSQVRQIFFNWSKLVRLAKRQPRHGVHPESWDDIVILGTVCSKGSLLKVQS